MPTTTARGLVVPNLTGDGADLHQMFLDLANSIEAMMNSALVLAAAPTAPFFVADSATSAGLSMRDSGATAGLRRSYVINDDGHTYLRHPNDADAAVVNVGWDYNHLTGVVDLPGGFTGRRVDSPYFRAYRSTAVSYATAATVVFNSETDPNGWYDTATGIFLPTAAGMYRVSWAVAVTPLGAGKAVSSSLVATAATIDGTQALHNAAFRDVSVGSVLLPFNGSTDNAHVTVSHDNGGSLGIDFGPVVRFEAERIGA